MSLLAPLVVAMVMDGFLGRLAFTSRLCFAHFCILLLFCLCLLMLLFVFVFVATRSCVREVSARGLIERKTEEENRVVGSHLTTSPRDPTIPSTHYDSDFKNVKSVWGKMVCAAFTIITFAEANKVVAGPILSGSS